MCNICSKSWHTCESWQTCYKKPLPKSNGFTIMEFMLALAGGILVLLAAFFAWEKFGSPLVFKYTATNEFNTVLSQAASIRSSWGGTYPQVTITNIGQDCTIGQQAQVSAQNVVCNALTNGNQTTLNALLYWGYSCNGGTLTMTGYFGNVPGGVGSNQAASLLSSIASSVQSDSGWDCTSGNNGSGVQSSYGTITCVKTGVVCSAQLQ